MRAIVIALGATVSSCCAAEEKPYRVVPGPAELAATIRSTNSANPPGNLDGLGFEIHELKIAWEEKTGLTLSVYGFVLNGFDEDVFVRKIEPIDLGARGEATTSEGKKASISAGAAFRSHRNEFYFLAGRDRTQWRKSIRDDGGEVFRGSTPMMPGGVLEMFKLVTSPEIIGAEVNLTVSLAIEFYRKGDAGNTVIDVTIPAKVRVQAKPSQTPPSPTTNPPEPSDSH